MTRNFKTLEVGKYYVTKVSSHPVRIVESSNNSFLSSEGDTYRLNGTCTGERSNLYDLTTEVTVTVTPVEPKKPRECWALYIDSEFRANFESRIEAENYMPMDRNVIKSIVHMREVIDEGIMNKVELPTKTSSSYDIANKNIYKTFRKIWILDVHETTCPTEVLEEVRVIWHEYYLSNDNSIFFTTLNSLTREKRHIIVQYVKECEPNLDPDEQFIIHLW